jgi:hypothetical protein
MVRWHPYFCQAQVEMGTGQAKLSDCSGGKIMKKRAKTDIAIFDPKTMI